MAKLQALLVGINDYHPDSGVSSLNGCMNDLAAMENFLKENYKSAGLSLKVLRNEEATREGVIHAFQEHLIENTKSGDTAFFYYCGHGSFAPTAKEFEAFDPKKQDETLVCYDSRLPNKYDLADKEIALLLHLIPDGINTVFLADSCHSGSITRSAVQQESVLGKSRFSEQRDDVRILESYMLDGNDYYPKMLKETGKLSIPHSKHIVLAACDRDEQAWETKDGRGLFSSTLLNVLEMNKRVSYADLFAQIRGTIRQKSTVQMPGIYAYEQFNPNKIFLMAKAVSSTQQHLIKYVDGKWRMEYGAIHGLPTDPEKYKEIQVAIFSDITEAEDREDVIETVKVKEVKLKECILDFDYGDDEAQFQGEIVSLPTGMSVLLEGEGKAKTKFKSLYKKQASPFLSISDTADHAKYKLCVDDDKLVIYLTENKKLIHGMEKVTKSSVSYIVSTLETIEEWERLAGLKNEGTQLADSAIEIAFYEENKSGDLEEAESDTITLNYPKAKPDDKKGEPAHVIWYQMKARNTSDSKLYVSLVHLSPEFGVSPHFTCQEIPSKSDWITMDDQHGLYISNPKDNEVTDIFKVLIATDPFDDYKFSSEGFEVGLIKGATRGTITRDAYKRKKAEADWMTKTITVNTIRQVNAIGSRSVELAEGITFKKHPSFKAEVGFAPAKSPTRSIHPTRELPDIFQHAGEVVNLSPTRGSQDKSIIELSGIENEASLQDKPLEMTVHKKLKKGEYFVPVTYDGEFVIPVGMATKNEDGSTSIKIDAIPAVDDLNRKRKTRSLTRSLWFCLLKVVGMEDEIFLLRHAQLNAKGKLVRSKSAVPSKVDKANKILLVVHGIIGDTKDMAKNLMFLVEEGHYDLMLTYDYENLNEPIESTAKDLNKQLEAVGLGKDDGKTFDIIAHSMGGLVSRYMIENVRKGDNLVDQMIMFGTPNGGSPFGNVPGYLNILTKLMGVALNFGKPLVGAILKQLSRFNKGLTSSKKVTKTLGQMAPDSEFVQALFKHKKPSTKYTVIAGDITQYVTHGDTAMARFVENVLLKTGNFANRDVPNDIAVGLDEAKAIPSSFEVAEYEVVGHHLNYFVNDASMGQLRKLYVIDGERAVQGS